MTETAGATTSKAWLRAVEAAMSAEDIPREKRDRVLHWLIYGDSPDCPDVEAKLSPAYFLLVCRDCADGELVMPFESATARGKWAVAHTAGTEHRRFWSAGSREQMSQLMMMDRRPPGWQEET